MCKIFIVKIHHPVVHIQKNCARSSAARQCELGDTGIHNVDHEFACSDISSITCGDRSSVRLFFFCRVLSKTAVLLCAAWFWTLTTHQPFPKWRRETRIAVDRQSKSGPGFLLPFRIWWLQSLLNYFRIALTFLYGQLFKIFKVLVSKTGMRFWDNLTQKRFSPNGIAL